MPVQQSDFDPYRSPALPERTFEPMAGPRRPGWLTAICVIAIVIGILGLFNGLFGLAGVLFGQQLQSAITPAAPPGMSQGMQKVQQDFQNEMQAVQGRFFAALLTSALFRIVVAAALLLGGVLCLSLKPQGRQLLTLAFGLAIGFEICHVILQSLINMEMMTALNAFIEGFLQEMPQGQRGPPQEFVTGLMRTSIVAGFVFQYVIALVKLVLYSFGLIYLQRAPIKALFTSPAETQAVLK
jgi:hypothetical protein